MYVCVTVWQQLFTQPFLEQRAGPHMGVRTFLVEVRVGAIDAVVMIKLLSLYSKKTAAFCVNMV